MENLPLDTLVARDSLLDKKQKLLGELEQINLDLSAIEQTQPSRFQQIKDYVLTNTTFKSVYFITIMKLVSLFKNNTPQPVIREVVNSLLPNSFAHFADSLDFSTEVGLRNAMYYILMAFTLEQLGNKGKSLMDSDHRNKLV